jgi:hypothetical protein
MNGKLRRIHIAILCTFLVTALGAGGAEAQYVKPADPQPTADQLRPGLAVVYYSNFFRHIRELVEWEDYKEGKPGEPITQLNYRVGQGDVLTSGMDDGVGAKMTGYILLDTPGAYSFAFESNDGVRLEIDGQIVVDDPDVHGDRFSDIGAVIVEEPGWHPITIRYFERKSTSTLMFHWLPPGAEGTMPLVPPEVLAHRPE